MKRNLKKISIYICSELISDKQQKLPKKNPKFVINNVYLPEITARI